MDKKPKINENHEQTYSEAMAETQEILKHAEDWILLTTTLNINADRDGCELSGASKFFANQDRIVEMMVTASLNEPAFGRAVLKSALLISNHIKSHDHKDPENEI